MADEKIFKLSLTAVLAGLLVIAAFLVGALWTKVKTLESQGEKVLSEKTEQPTQNQPGENAPQAKPVGEVPPVGDNDHIRGNKNAQVVLIEYSDFECPFCKRFHPTMEQVMKEYGEKVAWVYRNYPLPFHSFAQKAAEAAECAGNLGGNEAFWKYTDVLFEKQGSAEDALSVANLKALAKSQGLSASAFDACLDNGKQAQKIKDQMADGQKAGISGTPGTVIIAKNGKKELIPGALPYESVKQMIDESLK